MKTKFLKSGMPLMVFMLAIVFAFATEPKNSLKATLSTGYILQNNVCQSVTIECNNEEALPCMYGGGEIVHRDNFITFCDVVLYHKPK